MKLSSITSGVSNRSRQIRLLYGTNSNLIESAPHGSTPLSYLFIESVIQTKTVNESSLEFLKSLLSAGLNKLRTALTADSSDDLGILLDFMSPNKGGINKVRQLLAQAETFRGNLLNDQQWFNMLFDTTGVDGPVRQNILQQIATNFNPSYVADGADAGGAEEGEAEAGETDASGAEAEEADAGGAEAGGANAKGARGTRGARGASKRSDYIKQKRQKEQDYNEYLTKQLEQLDKNRAANRAEMEKLLKAIRQKQSQTESICDRIAYRFLTENDMQYNIRDICDLMNRKIYAEHRVPLEKLVIEQGYVSQLKKAFSNAGNLLVNPALAIDQLNTSNAKNTNQRISKIAIQLITNHLRQTFNEKLQSANLMPGDIIEDYKNFVILSKKVAQPNQTPQDIAQYNQLLDKMRQVYELFGKTFQYSTAAASTPSTDEQEVPPPNSAGPEAPQSADTANDGGTDSLNVAGPSGVEDQPQIPSIQDTASADKQSQQSQQSTGRQSQQPQFTDKQKEAGRQLLMRMIQAGRSAGLNQSQQSADGTKIFYAIKEAGKKVASQYAKVDKQVAQAAYSYYVQQLIASYRTANSKPAAS